MLTPEQYLEIERKAEYKNEYLNGEMFAMSASNERHNILTVNLTFTLGLQARARGRGYYVNNMRLHITPTGLYTYPDCIVVSGESQFADAHKDTLLNRTFLVEVVSPSTEAYDRGRKFEHYQSLESLSQYLLVAQDRMRADLYTRQPDGRWLLSTASRPEDAIEIESVGGRISMADLYRQVEFPVQ
jgi:Uma2 family endonuclease